MNTKTKRGFTLEEHWQFGNLLHNIYMALQSQLVSVGTAYPLKSRQVTQLGRSLKALGEARCALDDSMFKEHGDAASTKAYYPFTYEKDLKSEGKGMKGKECGRCVVLANFLATSGLLLRHVNRSVVGDKIAHFYLYTMKELCPEVRELVEKKEAEVDDDFMASLPRELRDRESSLHYVVGLMYGGSDGVTE